MSYVLVQFVIELVGVRSREKFRLWHNWPAKQSNSVEKCKIKVITRSRSF